MDWITLLRSLQSDFIKRLTSGCLLHCKTEGQYSELTVISGERLKALREFCWQMAEKYKRTSPVRDVFIYNLKGKLGEEVVKERLADFVTEIDYERRFGGDGKVDFTLTSDPSVGIAVKSRYGSIDKVRWSISAEEVEKNAVVVCILIQEDVNEAQPEYHLFLAGFLPTQMIKLKTGKISFGINQLLYGGGLPCYLEQLQSSVKDNSYRQKSQTDQHNPRQSPTHKQPKNQFYSHADLNLLYVKRGDECFQKGHYDAAITSYNEALRLNPKDANTHYKRANARHHLRDYEGAIKDYTQAITINPNYAKAYNKSGNVRYHLGDYEGAIEDYTQAIKINPYLLKDQQEFIQAIKIYANDNFVDDKRGNVSEIGDYKRSIEVFTQVIEISPNDAVAYKNRGNTSSDLGDYEKAIEDYTQAIKINPHDADAYYNRGNARYSQGDKLLAIEDFQKATNLYQKEGKLAEHKNARERILDLQIEQSLDILNF